MSVAGEPKTVKEKKDSVKIPLKKLRRLEILAKEKTTSFLQGHRQSIFRGPGTEYADLREYIEGDDLRFVDWNASSRVPFKLIVRDYEQERNTNVILMLDTSYSMLLGEPNPRIKMAVEAIATLAYTVMNNRDNFGWVSFSEKIHKCIPARGGKTHLYHIFNEMLRIAPFGSTNIGETVKEIALAQKRRSIIIVLTDLHGNLEEAMDGFKVANVKHHDFKLFHIHDPEEFLFPKNPRQVKYQDPETGEIKIVNFSNLLERGKFMYELGLEIRKINEFKRKVRGLNIEVIDAPTTVLTEKLLLAYFGSKRRGLVR
ncbi:MAG: DUF58 domain-containing protein [Candidatus Heimdallarchaeota archaeon]|nr:DUF58 domain-containing protein [Candidatus Heimdallarchaeota archaeon]MCG3255084.1 DUF58 domain-containing protein [Candidatus Heimdallarchaeota archaeon]MCK4610158.1 DUF58 domain-containing protein [Candidatus Heimdallarchaeota archaeon]